MIPGIGIVKGRAGGSSLLNSLSGYHAFTNGSTTSMGLGNSLYSYSISTTGGLIGSHSIYNNDNNNAIGFSNLSCRTPAYTINFWYNHNGNTLALPPVLVSENMYNMTTGEYVDPSPFYFKWFNSTTMLLAGETSITSGGSIYASSYYMFTLVWDQATRQMKLYINSNYIGYVTIYSYLITNTDDYSDNGLEFANQMQWSGTYNFRAPGKYDELGFWTRGLTQTEITTLYNGGAGKTYPF